MTISREPFDSNKLATSQDSRTTIGPGGPSRVIQSYKDKETKEETREKSILSMTEKLETSESIPEVEKEDKKESNRKDAWARAHEESRKAAEERKAAAEERKLLKQEADQLRSFLEKAKNDPRMAAKAIGMDEGEFYRRYTNQMYSIEEEAKQPANEPLEQKVDRLEKERIERDRADRERSSKIQFENDVKNYIKTKIEPALEDPDRYELIHKNGKDSCLGYIYDIMNSYYLETGEELNATEVADAFEKKLLLEAKDKKAILDSIKKLAPEEQPHLGSAKKTISGSQRSNIQVIDKDSTSIIQRRNEIKEAIQDKRERVLLSLAAKGQ